MNSPADPTEPQRGELFEALHRDSTLADRVAGQIETMIIEGRLQRGDLLPPERELSRQFGVSRTVIREAVRGLAARHLVEVRPGSGTVITRPTVQSVARSMMLLLGAGARDFEIEKVLEVRRLLEVEIAGMAAEKRGEQDIARLDETLRRTASALGDRKAFARADVDFHAALATASHNELFSVLLDSIADVMLQVRLLGFRVPGTPERGLKFHRQIFEQVKKGDPDAARQAMREHLVEAEETMRRAQSLLNQEKDKPA